MFKLYTIDGSSATIKAVEMTAEALQLTYESQNVNLMAKEHLTPEYLEKNPAHTVPMIEEDDFYLADSHAIITYLVSKYGDEEQSKLYPSDLRTRAIVNQRLFFEATVLNKAYNELMLGILLHGQIAPTPQQIKDVLASYEIMERYLQKTKFVACDHVTVADISCVAYITATDFWVPVDDNFPKMKEWLNTLQKEDWYKKGNLRGLRAYEAYFNSLSSKGA